MIVCNDLDIIQHASKIVVSGDVTNDTSMKKDCLHVIILLAVLFNG
jgi:hypothetical protein